MKNVLIIFVFALISSTAGAQDVCPEFANMVNVINEGGTAGKELGMERAIAKQKKKGIYRGYDNSVRLEGPGAKTTVTRAQSFAFKPFHASIHPAQQIKLYAFNPKKDFRELVVGGTNTFGGSKNRKSKDESVPLTIEKISDGCYKVTPGVPLPKGQYAFVLGTASDAQGTTAGAGSTTTAQVWFGFAIK